MDYYLQISQQFCPDDGPVLLGYNAVEPDCTKKRDEEAI
jgi:hypothetical protein